MRRLALAALVLALVLAYAAQLSQAADSPDSLLRLPLEPLEYSLGRADAPVTIVEFTDYQCPYCRRFQAESFPRLKHDWIDTGRVRFIVRDLPLAIHSAARFGAEAAHCAGAQGKFWPMHEALLKKDLQLNESEVLKLAATLGVDSAQLKDCIRGNRYEAAITKNADQASDLGIHGTPAFIVGKSSARELRGVLIEGAVPYSEFDAALRQLQ